jgi:hypothetical protein
MITKFQINNLGCDVSQVYSARAVVLGGRGKTFQLSALWSICTGEPFHVRPKLDKYSSASLSWEKDNITHQSKFRPKSQDWSGLRPTTDLVIHAKENGDFCVFGAKTDHIKRTRTFNSLDVRKDTLWAGNYGDRRAFPGFAYDIHQWFYSKDKATYQKLNSVLAALSNNTLTFGHELHQDRGLFADVTDYPIAYPTNGSPVIVPCLPSTEQNQVALAYILTWASEQRDHINTTLSLENTPFIYVFVDQKGHNIQGLEQALTSLNTPFQVFLTQQ